MLDGMAVLLTMEVRSAGPERLLSPEARGAANGDSDPFIVIRNTAPPLAPRDPVQQMPPADLCLQLPSQCLPKVDRATMAIGREARVPILDDAIGRLVVPLESTLRMRGAEKKVVMRAAACGRIPVSIRNAPKREIGVPYGHWLRTALSELAADLKLGSRFTARFGFDRARLEAGLRAHRLGDDRFAFGLWKCLAPAMWQADGST